MRTSPTGVAAEVVELMVRVRRFDFRGCGDGQATQEHC
jgi:hypothetical protein